MARRLNPFGSAWPGRVRGGRFVALVIAVSMAHGCVTREVADRLEGFAAAARMPKRIEVAYVRTLEPEAPPVAAPVVPPAPPKRRVARARPAKAASAAEPALQSPTPPPSIAETRSEPLEALPGAEAAASVPEVRPETRTATASAAAPSEPSSAAQRVVDAASGPPMATEAGVAASGEPFDWPASTRVSYDLTGNYRGEVNGTAQVEWIRVGTHYQVNLDLVVGPSFAPIITRRMSSEGELTAEGLAPNRYDEDTQVVFRERRRISVFFQPEGVVLANGQRRERWPGVQDTASQFIQLTYLFTTRPELLRVGGTVEVPLALARSIDRWTYDVLDEVAVTTPFGSLPAFHLKPRRATPKNGELSAEIWFSPQLRYLPVRIRIEQDAQTYLDLVIARKPELASR